LDNATASRPRRDTRWRSVVVQRSICLVVRANVLLAVCGTAGITFASTT
jgi:hypothetical protein